MYYTGIIIKLDLVRNSNEFLLYEWMSKDVKWIFVFVDEINNLINRMFKNTYTTGLLSIFSSCGSHPLQLWQVEVKNGHVRRITDKEISSYVLEIVGTNASTTYIIAPKGTKGLGISLPYMIMLVKNLKKPFTFEVTIIDDTGMRRRIRVSTFQSKTQIQPMCASMPIVLHAGWNKVQINLEEYTSRSFRSKFKEVVNVKINANILLRRIYFTETMLSEDELPHDYRLYKPIPTVKKTILKANNKENEQQQAIDRIANEINGRKLSKILEDKTKVTPAEAALTEEDVTVTAANCKCIAEQEISSKGDTAIEETPIKNETLVIEEETAPEGHEKSVVEDTAPSEPGEPIPVDESTNLIDN